MKVVVIGAGAFGSWTALHMLRKGHEVVLVDTWGSGNSRSSSGDETRVIRSVYKDEVYADLARRSAVLWRENEALFGQQIYYEKGVLNLIGRDESRWKSARDHFDALGFPYREYSLKELKRHYPLISTEGLSYAVLEPGAGYLLARAGCMVVTRQFALEGGQYVQARVIPPDVDLTAHEYVLTADGARISGDTFIFACGPWLTGLFPNLLSGKIKATRQDIFYFGYPENARPWMELPVWCDFASFTRDDMYYGIPAFDPHAGLFGFKVGEDVAGVDFDPDNGDRTIDLAALKRVREFMEFRFPGLKDTPLADSRVCQYESTPDAHLIADKVPGTENMWLLGGGSGHGYKLGASMGEYMSAMVTGEWPIRPIFSLDRFTTLIPGDVRR
ncbi:MAG: FAD-dependent oxidoreductase [Saprospiraceae bacterium]|nr:FAD-dependent oxidoreductase [Saprospiraceae bacterium]